MKKVMFYMLLTVFQDFEKTFMAHLCVAAHQLRNTGIEN